MGRKVIDCREHPSDANCSLKIEGTEAEVLRAATEHAVSSHGHKDTPELRQMLKSGMKEAEPARA
jgi:predicted small metal-binding protein